MAGSKSGIQLSSMRQLVEALGDEDNWTGVTDAVARRKRQNRLHQRAWRRRKALQNIKSSRTEVPKVIIPYCEAIGQYHAKEIQRGPSHFPAFTGESSGSLWPQSNLYMATDREHTSISSGLRLLQNKFDDTPATQKLIPAILPYFNPATSAFDFDDKSQRFLYPLPLDHRLITLSQYNVLRATFTNMKLLSLMHTMPEECKAAWSIATLSIPDAIPPSLFPTVLQQTVPHEPWIDCFPLGAFRDNLILNFGKFDHEDLCNDLMGRLYEGFDDVELRGILVWHEPWHADVWEVTEGFAKKWRFLLYGCDALIEATNRYRALRHEDKLVVEF